METRRIAVKIARQTLKGDSDGLAVLKVDAKDGYVMAVMATNIGTNCDLKAGGLDGVYKSIPTGAGSIDIAYGINYPHYFEDSLKFVFTATGANPVYEVLIEMLVEKQC